MSKLSDILIGQSISLVCFGEYVGFIHFGEDGHCRIETETIVIDESGNERAILPEPSQGVLTLVLGGQVQGIVIDSSFKIVLDNGSTIKAALMPGYESVTLSVNGEMEIY